jgi:hypothetical protein
MDPKVFLRAKTMENLKEKPPHEALEDADSDFSQNPTLHDDYLHAKEIFGISKWFLKNDFKLNPINFARALNTIFQFENGNAMKRTGNLVKDLKLVSLACRFMDHSLASYGALITEFSTNSLSIRCE